MKVRTKKLIIGYISNVFSFALVVTAIMLFMMIIRETSVKEYHGQETENVVYTFLSQEAMSDEGVAANDGYIICEYEGRIAVFSLREYYPVRILDKYVSELSSDTVCDIRRGICVNGMAEVDGVLEKLLN